MKRLLALIVLLPMILLTSCNTKNKSDKIELNSLDSLKTTNGRLSSQQALDMLVDRFNSKETNSQGETKYIWIQSGTRKIDNVDCYLFTYGEETDDKFTAQRHFAVSEDGDLYEMDVINGGEYILY